MKSSVVLRRLLALEAEIRRNEPPPNSPLGMWLIAYHVGHWQPNESVAEATARALGYDNSVHFLEALRADHGDLDARYQSAISKMLAPEQIGDSPNHGPATELYRLVDDAERGGMPLPPIASD